MAASPDAIRDALALVQCSLASDQEGADVIKDAANLGEVSGVLADITAVLLAAQARGDPLELLGQVRAGLTERDGPAG